MQCMSSLKGLFRAVILPCCDLFKKMLLWPTRTSNSTTGNKLSNQTEEEAQQNDACLHFQTILLKHVFDTH